MIRLLINVKEIRPPDVARDAFRVICRKAFSHIAHYWYKNFFPRHFTTQAKHKYGHKPRSKKYLDNKRKLAQRGIVALGGVVDNVFTGDMAKALLSGAIIRGFPTRGKVEMRGPNYLRMRFKAGTNQPNKKRELVDLADDELKILLAEFKRFVLREMKTYRGTRKQKTYS
jgi:hypothetical protein